MVELIFIGDVVVMLLDSLLLGIEIKYQSRHEIFNLRIESNLEWVLYKDQWVGVHILHWPLAYNWFSNVYCLCYQVFLSIREATLWDDSGFRFSFH